MPYHAWDHEKSSYCRRYIDSFNRFVLIHSNDKLKTIRQFTDGFSYERSALEEWFERGKITSPMTNLEISSEVLDNSVLRERIEDYLREMDFNSFDFEQKEEMWFICIQFGVFWFFFLYIASPLPTFALAHSNRLSHTQRTYTILLKPLLCYTPAQPTRVYCAYNTVIVIHVPFNAVIKKKKSNYLQRIAFDNEFCLSASSRKTLWHKNKSTIYVSASKY